MRIAESIEMLEISAEMGTLHPVLAWDGKDAVLIDTGMPMQVDALRAAVESAGFALADITKVILTHQDLDHIGSAKALSEMGAEIMAHETEAPYIQGDVQSIRLTDMESRLNEMDEGERAFYEHAKQGAPYFYTRVDRRLKDGERLPFCGGIRIIFTPGHTPGHTAVLFEESNILVAGDAANILDGKLTGADPAFTRDTVLAEESFGKIKAVRPASVVCYHGGIIA